MSRQAKDWGKNRQSGDRAGGPCVLHNFPGFVRNGREGSYWMD